MEGLVQVFGSWFTAKLRSERGANLVEYVLLLVLIVIVALFAVEAFGTGVSTKFDTVNSSISTT